MWNTAVSRRRLGAFALFLSLSGCTAISDSKYELGQKIRTSQAWHDFDGCNQQCFTCDYRSGWKAGYYDVLTGGTGCAPVVPPKQYWKPPVFFEHDPNRRNDWYCGFQDGAACANCEPDHHYIQAFLPGPACCPTSPVSYSEVPVEPTEFPLEHVTSEPSMEPVQSVEPSEGEAPAAPETPPGETAPSEPVTPEEPAKGDEYDKSPEPSNTQRKLPAGVISRQRIVTQNKSATPSSESLLQQLVSNATKNQ